LKINTETQVLIFVYIRGGLRNALHSSTKRLLGSGGLSNAVLLEGAREFGLLLRGLEAAVTELGRGADEFEVYLLLLVLDDTILDTATHGGDVLGGKIVLRSGGVVGLAGSIDRSAANLVDLLVELSAVERTVLTSAGNGPTDTGRVPRSNASHAAETETGDKKSTF